MSAADVINGAARWHVEHGESLAFLRSLPDACVDAVITDPPYSSGGAFRGDRMSDPSDKYVQTGVQLQRLTFAGDNRDQRAYEYWCALWLSECLRIAKPGAPLCVFTDWRQLPTTTDAVQAGGWVWRGIAVWDKTEASRPRLGAFRSQSEFVVWGSSGPLPDRPEVGVLPGVWRVIVNKGDKHHLTGKPTEVMRNIVRIAPPGGLILDPFSGSGTTGVAAMLEGYRFIGAERVEEYCCVARDRVAGAAGEFTTSQSAQAGLFDRVGSER